MRAPDQSPHSQSDALFFFDGLWLAHVIIAVDLADAVRRRLNLGRPFFCVSVSRQIVHVTFIVAIFPEKCLHGVYAALTRNG
jgi:hypothetical protein